VLYLSPLSSGLLKLRHPLLGCMRTPANDRAIPPGLPWAADCGIRVATSSDPAAVDRYLAWLDRKPPAERASCLFAVAPDVLGDAEATWRRSAPLLPRIRALGYPAAFVAQDGFDPAAVDWTAFDVLFIGGLPRTPRSLEWKRSETGGYAAIREAHARGLPVHVGRVNGEPYLRNLALLGVRSVDGTQLTYASMVPRTLRWLDRLDGQAALLEHG
jgi:hypothetical protein